MKNFLKTMHKNRIFALLIWLVIMFVAIISLPNVNQVAETAGVPSMNSNTQMMNAQKAQNQWGYNTDKTKVMNVVYHKNKGKITKSEQNNIYQKVGEIQKNDGRNGIGRIITAKTSPNGQSKFISQNGSTEIVQLHVNQNVAGNPAYAGQIKSKFQSPDGLQTYVTNPELTAQSNDAKVLHITNIVSIVAFILAILFIGIAFKSIIAPLLSFITLYVSYLVSLSATALMTTKWHFPYSVYTPLVILLVVLIFGTLASFFLFRKFEFNLNNGEDEQTATDRAVHSLAYPLWAIAIILSIAFGSFYFLKFNPISAMSNLFVPFIGTTLAILTINPLFMELLGKVFFWPQKKSPKGLDYNSWDKLTRFGLWKPVLAIIAVLVVIIPFAACYRHNVTYLNNNNLTANEEPETADRILQANFGTGKATPVTIYIQSNKKTPINTENTLEPIDQVTTKLQSLRNVANVYSVTQPGGEQIGKYYLKDQLTNTNDSIKDVNSSIKDTRKKLGTSKNSIKAGNLKSQIAALNSLKGQLAKANNTDNAAPASNGGPQSIEVSRQTKKVQRTMRNLQAQIEQKSQQISTLNAQLSDTASSVNDVQDGLQSSSAKMSSAESDITQVDNSLKNSQRKLKTSSDYLTGIQNSVAGKTYYATPQDINDTDFYQTMSNFNSENGDATMVQVLFKNAPDGKTNADNISQMEQTVNTQLQGTKLNKAKVSYTGLPVENAFIKHEFDLTFAAALALLFVIVLAGLIIVSRSILQPLWWLLTFVLSSIAGLQVTELIMNYTTYDSQLTWNAFNALLVPLAVVGTVELTFLAVSYRKENPDIMGWLHAGINEFGKTAFYVAIATILVIASLFVGYLHAFDYIALVVLLTTLIFNIALPILMAALGKLSLSLPTTKLHHLKKIKLFSKNK